MKSNNNKIKVSRKQFLKMLVGGTGVITVFNGLQKFSPLKAKSLLSPTEGSKHSWAMVIDQSKCNGCGFCIKACQASNNVAPDINWTDLYQVNDVGNQKVYLSVPCMHCEHAPCVSVCPVKASYYRDDGLVMMDYDKCIGCRYCQVACPYDARSFNWDNFDGDNPAVPEWGEPDIERRPRGVVEKCSFCYQKIDRGLSQGLIPGVDPSATPACVTACPPGARLFGDLNDPKSNVSLAIKNSPSYRLREELGTGPRVYYLPANRKSEEGS